MCLCSTNMAERVTSSIREFDFEKLTFTEFMDECVAEVDPAINTQMGLGLNIFSSQRGLGMISSWKWY